MFEVIIVFASNKWFIERPFTISVVTVILALMLMRWGVWAVVQSIALALAYAITFSLLTKNGLMMQTLIIYGVGNCFCLLLLIPFKIIGKQKIRDKTLLSALFVVLVYLTTHLGYSILSVCLFNAGFGVFYNFFVYDSISLLFGVVIILILRRLDGMFEDQKTYLLRVYKANKEEHENNKN